MAKKLCRVRLWQKNNRERMRANARDAMERVRLKQEGKLIPPNNAAAINRWWQERGFQ